VAVIFPRWTNWTPLVGLALAPGALLAPVFAIWYWFSPEFTDVGYMPEQPVPYSHKLHAGDLGIDCRYCHNTVERGAAAAIPPAATCMNCHKVVKSDSEKLAPVRAAFEKDEPLAWTRVHLLPDYAFFDHSVHVAAGVGCVSCHGRIDQMPEVKQEKPLSMSWCLDCHTDPAPKLRPKDQVTNMTWAAPEGGYDPHADRERFPSPPQHCSGCHR
jgi:hypothetical protein